ncbi:MAG: ribonuclease G [Abditibacteriota bacterium]|nr:ribonuclease G [Abditibacteriota bacterium]
MDYGDYENDSGEGEDAELPPQLRGLNWGAFFLGWIWGIAHNLLITLLTLIPYVGFIMNFVLLFKGNEWAWQNRRFKSVDHFKKVQRIWLIWGIIYFLFLLFVVGSWLFVAYMMLMTRSKVG